MSNPTGYWSDAHATPERHETAKSTEKVLRIYVNDHRAGAVAGVALCRRIAERYTCSPLGEAAGELVGEIENDREELERWAQRHAIAPNPLKNLVARLVEMATRAKLNGHLIRRSPLSPVLELEALLAGIDAKRSLWHSLEAAGLPAGDTDFGVLIGRATEQRARLAPFHAAAAAEAFNASVQLSTPASEAPTSG